MEQANTATAREYIIATANEGSLRPLALTAPGISRRPSWDQYPSPSDALRAAFVPQAQVTWAMIDRRTTPSTELCFDRLPGVPLMGLFTAASASMLIWGAALLITLRLV